MLQLLECCRSTRSTGDIRVGVGAGRLSLDGTVLVMLREGLRQGVEQGEGSGKIQMSWDVIPCRWAGGLLPTFRSTVLPSFAGSDSPKRLGSGIKIKEIA